MREGECQKDPHLCLRHLEFVILRPPSDWVHQTVRNLALELRKNMSVRQDRFTTVPGELISKVM